MKHVFEPITPADYADTDKPDDCQMIFILGMPRSGTSLTEQILSTHSQVYGAGELHYMGEETAELMYMFGLQPEVKLVKVAFDSIRAAYLNHIESLGVKERIITDKMPHNFLNLGYVLACFPKPRSSISTVIRWRCVCPASRNTFRRTAWASLLICKTSAAITACISI